MPLSADLLNFCREHETNDIPTLLLQANRYEGIDMTIAVQQIKGLQIAKKKLPSYYETEGIIYPPHLALEQCSSEQTARYKMQLIEKGKAMVDLTGGFGIDISFLSTLFKDAVYVERQMELSHLAEENFKVLERSNIQVKNLDATEYLEEMESVDFIYLDPARRDVIGKKTVLIEDCTPNLLDIQSKLEEKGSIIMIKLSPMLDITLALQQLNNVADIHIVSVDNECKELLFIKKSDINIKEPLFHCVNITNHGTEYFSFLKSQETDSFSEYTSTIEQYLYEPNASIMKGGAYNTLSNRFHLKKLHPNSHLYTSSDLIEDFPGRKFKVKTSSTMNKKELRRVISGIENANVAIRNFPLKAEELRDRLKLKDGGDTFIFGTTLNDNGRIIVICEKV